jgi:hypothetical protein
MPVNPVDHIAKHTTIADPQAKALAQKEAHRPEILHPSKSLPLNLPPYTALLYLLFLP